MLLELLNGILTKALEGYEAGGEAECRAHGVGDCGAEVVEQIDHWRFEAKAIGDEHGDEEERESNDGKSWAVEFGRLHELEKRPCTKKRDDDAEWVKPDDATCAK